MGHDGHCFGWPVRHSERHRVRLSGHLRPRRVPTGAGPGAGCAVATAHPGQGGRASGRARPRQASAVSHRANAMLPTPQARTPSTLAQQRTAPTPLACALALVIAPVAALAPADRRPLRAKSARRTPATSASLGAIKATLSAAELAIAEHVHVGRMPCELGAFVTVTADPATPGYFHVQGKGFKYHMAPVLTSTGTARLEDTKGGAVWLQIANKSMLISHPPGPPPAPRHGAAGGHQGRRRLAANCEQVDADEPAAGPAPGRCVHEPGADAGGRGLRQEPAAEPSGAAACAPGGAPGGTHGIPD